MKTLKMSAAITLVWMMMSFNSMANGIAFYFRNTTKSDANLFLVRQDDACGAGAQSKESNSPMVRAGDDNIGNEPYPSWLHKASTACGVKGYIDITMNKGGQDYKLRLDYDHPVAGKDHFSYSHAGPFYVRNVGGNSIISDGTYSGLTAMNFEIYEGPVDNCEDNARVAIAQKMTDQNIKNHLGNPLGSLHQSKCDPQYGDGYYLITNTANSDVYYGCKVGKACAIWSDIWNKYHDKNVGAEHGRMGWPTGDEFPTPKLPGYGCHFQDGSIYWSQAGGAHPVWGAIRDEWAKNGWENGPIGFPTSDEKGLPGNTGVYQEFQGGYIYYKWADLKNAQPAEQKKAHTVRGDILKQYSKFGYEKGQYGFPVDDEKMSNGKHFQPFEYNSISL